MNYSTVVSAHLIDGKPKICDVLSANGKISFQVGKHSGSLINNLTSGIDARQARDTRQALSSSHIMQRL